MNKNNNIKYEMKLQKFKKKRQIKGGGEGGMDIAALTEKQINELVSQGVTLDQLDDLADEQGVKSPILEKMLKGQNQEPTSKHQIEAPTIEDQMASLPPVNKNVKKSSSFPPMMDTKTYGEYQKVMDEEKKRASQEHKPNIYGYTFSPLISEEIMEGMRRTQGSFFIGVNISNLINTFRNMVVSSETNNPSQQMIKSNPDSIFDKIGEWVDVDFEHILDKKMGVRGADIPLIPEKQLTDYSTFYEILEESKKYSDRGFNGKITPFGLLIMTRMLYKYRSSNSQWFRVATVLELIHKYLGIGMGKEQYFKTKGEIPLFSLMELEEFYNTDHIFMSEDELNKFKKELDFYKYDNHLNVKQKIMQLTQKNTPI
jgi:hypothetical protein